jgi:hypothetical protein
MDNTLSSRGGREATVLMRSRPHSLAGDLTCLRSVLIGLNHGRLVCPFRSRQPGTLTHCRPGS